MAFSNLSIKLIHSFKFALGGLKSMQISFYEKAADLSSAIDDIVSDSFKTPQRSWRKSPKAAASPIVSGVISSPETAQPTQLHAYPDIVEIASDFSSTSTIVLTLGCVIFTMLVAFIYMRCRRLSLSKEKVRETTKLNRPKLPVPEMRLAPPHGTSFAIPVYFRPLLNKRMTTSDSLSNTEITKVRKDTRRTVDDAKYSEKQNPHNTMRTATVGTKATEPTAMTETSQLNLSQVVMASSGTCANVTGELLVYALDLTEKPTERADLFTCKSQCPPDFSHACDPVGIGASQLANTPKQSCPEGLPRRPRKQAFHLFSRGKGKMAVPTKRFHKIKTPKKHWGRELGLPQQNAASPRVSPVHDKSSNKELKTEKGSPKPGNESINSNDIRPPDYQACSISLSPFKQLAKLSSPPDKTDKDKPSHSVYLQAPTGHGLFNLRSKPESREPPGRWAGGLPKERIFEIRQKTRIFETSVLTTADKSTTPDSTHKQRQAPFSDVLVGQHLKTLSSGTHATNCGEQSQTKHKHLGRFKKDIENGNLSQVKYKTVPTSNDTLQSKTNRPDFFSSIIAKQPKKQKTKGKKLKRKAVRSDGKKEITENLIGDLEQKVSNEFGGKIPVLPIRPLASPVKQPDSHNVGTFELRKTATPNLSSLCGKGAFTSYSKQDETQNELSYEDAFTPGQDVSIPEVPAATSVDTLHEGTVLSMDQQHNQARHNPRFLNTSATEPQSSSNDLSLMTETRIVPTQFENPTVSFRKVAERGEETRHSKGTHALGNQDARIFHTVPDKKFLHPLLKRSHARTISLSQESKSKEFDKSFSINLQLSTQMYNSNGANAVADKSTCELRKASPLQFEMPMQEPLYSDIVQTLKPTSKTVGPLCAKKSGMGAYLDEASKRTSASSLKCLNDNDYKKIGSNISKLTRQMSGKLSGNTVFRITRNRVTTLKTQQGQKTPQSADLGLMTRKQLFQQQNKSTSKPVLEKQSPYGVSDKPPIQGRRILPKSQISSTRHADNQRGAKTFRVRRNEGFHEGRLQWQPLSETISRFTCQDNADKAPLVPRQKENENKDIKMNGSSREPKELLFTRRLTPGNPFGHRHLETKERETNNDFPCSFELGLKFNNDCPILYRMAQPSDDRKIEERVVDKEKASLPHINEDKVIKADESRTITAQQEFSSSSKSGCNFTHPSESSSFISNPAKLCTFSDKALKKTQLGHLKWSYQRLSVPHVLSNLSPKRTTAKKYPSPKHHSDHRLGRCPLSSGRVCMAKSSLSSLLQHQNSVDSRRRGRMKKNGKKTTLNDNFTESKYCHRNTIKTPVSFRQESIKDNYIRHYKMKKTKLLRHEPYHRKKSLKTYHAKNRNNCSPLHKRHMALHSPILTQNLVNSAFRNNDHLSMASAYEDRQTRDVHCDSYVNKRERRLDLENKMCSLSFCHKRDHHVKCLPKSQKSTMEPKTRGEVSFNNRFSESLSFLQIQKNDSLAANCKGEFAQPEAGADRRSLCDTTCRPSLISAQTGLTDNDGVTNELQKYEDGSTNPVRNVSTSTSLQFVSGSERQSDPTSDTLPTTKSHMTQTDASALLLQNVAIQTSPAILHRGQRSSTKRLYCKNSSIVRKFIKHKARDMRIQRLAKQKRVLRLRPSPIEPPSLAVQRHIPQANSHHDNKSMCKASANKSMLTPELTKAQRTFCELPPGHTCCRGKTSVKQQNTDEFIKNEKTYYTSPHLIMNDTGVNKSLERKEKAAFNSSNKYKGQETDGHFELEVEHQTNSVAKDLNSERGEDSFSEAGGNTETVAKEISAPGMNFKSADMPEPVVYLQENKPGSVETLSPKKSELYKMCMIRPSWKNINIEEVDRRVDRALKLRRQLRLSRSTSARHGNTSLSSESGQDDSETYLLFSDGQNQIDRNWQKSLNDGICKTKRAHIIHDAGVGNSDKNNFNFSKGLEYERADTQKINPSLKHTPWKSDGKMFDATEMLRDSNIKLNTETEHPPALMLQADSTPPDLSCHTQRSRSAHNLMINTETVYPERSNSALFPANPDNASRNKRINLGRKSKNSPPAKVSRTRNQCFLNNKSLLVGPLVKRLPQVPLSSFVEWFIETSDPKNFITSDTSFASSDENKSVTLQLGSATESPNQVQEWSRVYPAGHRCESQNRLSPQTPTIDSVDTNTQNKHYIFKAVSQFSAQPFQMRSTKHIHFKKDCDVASVMPKDMDTNEKIKIKSDACEEVETMQNSYSYNGITSYSSDAETPKAFKTIAPNMTHTIQDNYITEKRMDDHQNTDIASRCAKTVRSKTNTPTDDTTTVENSVNSKFTYTDRPIRLCSGDYGGGAGGGGGNTRNNAEKSSMNLRQFDISDQLQNCSSSTGVCAAMSQKDLSRQSRTVGTQNHIISNKLLKDHNTDERSTPTSFNQEGPTDEIEINQVREKKYDPGIRHILMKMRQPEPGASSNNTDHKSEKVRITLRRSSDVSGIVAKFQSKNNTTES